MERKLKQRNVTCPGEMMKLLNERSKRNEVVCSANVHWFKWKELLSLFFTNLSSFRIKQFHVFSFGHSCTGIVKAKRFTTSATWEKFNFLKSDVTDLNVLKNTTNVLSNEELLKPNLVLRNVPSTKEGKREAYLVKNVCDEYYKEVPKFKSCYLGSVVDRKNI